jgi:hypothetical protein
MQIEGCGLSSSLVYYRNEVSYRPTDILADRHLQLISKGGIKK